MSRGELRSVIGKVGARPFGDVEVLFGQTESLAGVIGEFRPALAMTCGRSRDLRNALADDRLGLDQLRLAVAVRLRRGDRSMEGVEIMTIDLHRVPAEGLETLAGVVALRHFGHRVEGDVVGIIDEDEIVQPEVTGEGDRLGSDPFLEAAVARETDDRLVENDVVGRIEFRRRHLRGEGVADRIADALSERTGRGLDSDGLSELGVTRGLAVQLAEVFDLLHRQIVAREVEPAVEEHAAMAGGKDEAVAIEPLRLRGIVAEGAAKQHRADFRRAERQA